MNNKVKQKIKIKPEQILFIHFFLTVFLNRTVDRDEAWKELSLFYSSVFHTFLKAACFYEVVWKSLKYHYKNE
jgi:hypothetical protein